MSTTNPPAGPQNPGGDAPRPVTGPTPGSGPTWPANAAYGRAPDDHAGGGGANPEAIRAGHEADLFMVKPIMSIPLAVVIAFIVAFAVAAGVFVYVMNEGTRPDPFAHPEAVARGNEPLNERLARIDRAGREKNEQREVDQPRLEPLRRLEANGRYTTQPELPTGNSPYIHPESIMPDRVPGLQQAEYVGPEKKYARIPIGDAIRVAAGSKEMFPVQKTPSNPIGAAHRPSYSAAGRGMVPPAPKFEAKLDQPQKGKGAEDGTEPGKKPGGKDEPETNGKNTAPQPRAKTPEKK
jgi:hypothetical protein